MNNQLRSKLQPVRSRLRIQRLTKATIRGLMVGGVLAFLCGALGWLAGSSASTYSGLGLMIALPAAAATWSLFRPTMWVEAARAVDRHFNLQDRTITAVESSDLRADAWKEMQLQEALQQLDRIRPSEAVGITVRYDRLLIALAVNLVAVGVFISNWWLPTTSNVPANTTSTQRPLKESAVRRPTPTTVTPELIKASMAAHSMLFYRSPSEKLDRFSGRGIIDRYFDLLEDRPRQPQP